MLDALEKRPGKSLQTAFQNWSNTKAAYRFFSNGNVSEDKILEGHFAVSALRVRSTGQPGNRATGQPGNRATGQPTVPS